MTSFENNKIKIMGDAPIIVCAKCGKEFVSRGKRDEFAINNNVPAYCDECEKDIKGYYFGGPYNGRPVYTRESNSKDK